MNPNSATPRDRLDPRLFEQQRCADDAAAARYTATCTCREETMGRERMGQNMPRAEQTPCAPETESTVLALAMVYSPFQHWQNIYCEEDALMRGTIFEELDKPFYGPACMGGGCNG